MNSIYTNNSEITLFITKAQNKIADLSTLLVERAGDISPLNILILELIDFIEVLDNPLTTWTIDKVLRWIHEYNYRANLGELSYLNIYGYNTTLITNIGNDPISSSNIVDFEDSVRNIIKSNTHNKLRGLQGGNITERYHITKEMYDYLINVLHPSIDSNVDLELVTNGILYPSEYYELGSSIEVVDIKGSIIYNSEKLTNYFEYLKDGQLLGTRNTSAIANLQPNPISDISGIKSDTSYSFNASFPSGLKIVTKMIEFKQPMYYGVININNYTNVDALLQGTKLVVDKGELDLTFNLPSGNTSLETGYLVPYLFIPNSWGMITSATNNTFNFLLDFHDFGRDMPLVDGSIADGKIIINTTQLEGVLSFKFNW